MVKKAAERSAIKSSFLTIGRSNPLLFLCTVLNEIKPQWNQTAFTDLIIFFTPLHNFWKETPGTEKYSLRVADVSPRLSPLRDVSQGRTSATQRQKFNTDDAKSVRNPVRSANRVKCDVIKMKFLKLWDLSGYSERTMSKRPSCQKRTFGGKLSLRS